MLEAWSLEVGVLASVPQRTRKLVDSGPDPFWSWRITVPKYNESEEAESSPVFEHTLVHYCIALLAV